LLAPNTSKMMARTTTHSVVPIMCAPTFSIPLQKRRGNRGKGHIFCTL
jgi:hypothetical protein